MGVTAVHVPPIDFVQQQLDALTSDLPPLAIKIGMLGTKELVETVGLFLQELRRQQEQQQLTSDAQQHVWVVLDPVMISTSGSRLMDHDAQQALVDQVIPYVDLVTPNIYEAEALLGRSILSSTDRPTIAMEQAARDLVQLGCRAVLLKGGHAAPEQDSNNAIEYAMDYLLVAPSTGSDANGAPPPRPRLCDVTNPRGVWLQLPRTDTIHTHGTGCTLSSSIAAALALGQASRHGRRLGAPSNPASQSGPGGAYTAMNLVDACSLAKAYVAAGIAQGQGLGQGPGPVAHTGFPASSNHFPVIPAVPQDTCTAFVRIFQQPNGSRRHGDGQTDNRVDEVRTTLGRILPIVDSIEWIERLCQLVQAGSDISDVQLRVKGEAATDQSRILALVQTAQAKCQAAGVRLWINDYWREAVAAGCFGVHLGQEDLWQCIQEGGLPLLKANKLALGVSTHSFGELAVALGVQPSYISLGPIFATSSKRVDFDPQGLAVVQKWRQLIPSNVPLVVIGGINTGERATSTRNAGADCVAVIGAITDHGENTAAIADAITNMNKAMS
jgi:hydroxymethylpyrimidine kinase / phosphomethylpyrimidine kinase / thiamine-phosphate diphosphorylase